MVAVTDITNYARYSVFEAMEPQKELVMGEAVWIIEAANLRAMVALWLGCAALDISRSLRGESTPRRGGRKYR
jgi:hypothetical protein